MEGKTFFRNSNLLVLFSDQFFLKNNLLGKALKPPFLKQRNFFHEKKKTVKLITVPLCLT